MMEHGAVTVGVYLFVLTSSILAAEALTLNQAVDGMTVYNFGAESTMNFDQSEQICVQLGGHLASVHDEDVRFIDGVVSSLNLPATNMWIGLYTDDLTHPGGAASRDAWKWTDGTPMDYTGGWETAQPDPGEHCAIYNTGTQKWSSLPCEVDTSSAEFGFICKIVAALMLPVANATSTDTTTTTTTTTNATCSCTDAMQTTVEQKDNKLLIAILAVLAGVFFLTTVIAVTALVCLRRRMKRKSEEATDHYMTLTPATPNEYRQSDNYDKLEYITTRDNIDSQRHSEQNKENSYIDVVNPY